MIRIDRYQTDDGVVHESKTLAERYANERYGHQLCSLARKLLEIRKYTEMINFLEEHIGEFVLVKSLRDDIVLAQPTQDEES